MCFYCKSQEVSRTLTESQYRLLTATDSVSNSFELSAEMDSIGSERRRFSPRRDIASTYFDERIPTRNINVSLLLKPNKNVIVLPILTCIYQFLFVVLLCNAAKFSILYIVHVYLNLSFI